MLSQLGRSRSLTASFLAQKPVINGLPKPETEALPRIDLPHLPDGSASTPLPPTGFRLAYGAEFLYLCAEFPAERLTARDRGYQFGDGLIVTVAEPTPDASPSEHSYLLGFSYQERPEFQWASRVLWEHDCKSQLLPLGRAVEVAGAAFQGVGRLEVAIPWTELHPYHPWLSDAVGLNILLVKARGEHDADVFGLLPMEGGEQVGRSSIRLSFEEPMVRQGHQIAVVANGRIAQGETLRAAVAVCASEPFEDRLSARLRTGEGDLVALDRFPLRAGSGLTRWTWDVDTPPLAPGGYRIQWRSAKSAVEAEQGLSILPPQDKDLLSQRIRAAAARLPDHDAATLTFEAEDLNGRLSTLAPARTAGPERQGLERLHADLRLADEGQNPVASRRGIFRRAFRSRIDGTLQPFSVLVPKDYSDERWPLCVTFHGSGVDDLQYLWSMGPAGFPQRLLVAAPFGRGASSSFTQGRAQEDVAEAVASMCAAYAVQQDRILLMGFSMGAYGALRTYYEDPGRYRAVAVFCTPPTALLEGETHPDFTQPEYAKVFRATPVFAFHGRKDNSTPFAGAERMVAALRNAGADVTFAIDDEAGHQLPNAETLARYFRWVEDVIRA